MYGKMQDFGLTEIITFLGTSAVRSWYPVSFHPVAPQGAPSMVAG